MKELMSAFAGVHEVILAHVLAEDWVGKLRTRGLDDGLAVLAIGPVFAPVAPRLGPSRLALHRAAFRAFLPAPSFPAAVRAFASSAFVAFPAPSRPAATTPVSSVDTPPHTGISAVVAPLAAPWAPKPQGPARPEPPRARSPEARYPAAS